MGVHVFYAGQVATLTSKCAYRPGATVTLVCKYTVKGALPGEWVVRFDDDMTMAVHERYLAS